MEFAEFKPVVYLDSETSCLFLEQPEEVTAYRNILGELAQTASGAPAATAAAALTASR